MAKQELEKYAKETPLGWKVNLMNTLSMSLICLAEDIDRDLRRIKFEDGSSMHFDTQKKHQYRMMCDCLTSAANQFHKGVADATSWYNKLNIEGQIWGIVGGDDKMYDNCTCDAKELLQVMMLYVDRSHTDGGFYSILRYMRNLPTSNIFPEDEIARFKFKRPLAPCAGATIRCQYGEGVIRDRMNGDNWLIDLENGTQKVLTSQQFVVAV